MRTVERFDPLANAWETVAPMIQNRYGCSAAALEGKLYVAGGGSALLVGGSFLGSVERYDPSTNRWEAVAPLKRKRLGCGLAKE